MCCLVLCSCVCAGTCIGEKNHRLFMFYLFTQLIEALCNITVTGFAFVHASTFENWFLCNLPVMILTLMLYFAAITTMGLLCYNSYLIATNQVQSYSYTSRIPVCLYEVCHHLNHSPFSLSYMVHPLDFVGAWTTRADFVPTRSPRHGHLSLRFGLHPQHPGFLHSRGHQPVDLQLQ